MITGRIVSDVIYENGYACVYDQRGMILTNLRCDAVVGYGEQGFVVKRNGCYEVHRANGVLARPILTQYNFNLIKSDLRKEYLTWLNH